MTLKSIQNIFLTLLLILALTLTSFQLFFEKEANALFSYFKNFLFSQKQNEILIVGIDSDISSFSPASYENKSRNVLLNIYDSLIRPNRYLQLKPCLALSWGVLADNLTWEFNLRKDVVFHDGTSFDANDVMTSIDYAMKSNQSDLKTLLANIENVTAPNSEIVRIKTSTPDSSFPRKIAQVLIFPSEKKEIIANSISGTGPYILKNHEKGKSLSFSRNENYWGKKPKFAQTDFLIIPEKFDRLNALRDGKLNILLNVPTAHLDEIKSYDYTVEIRPGLEANFLFFNFLNPLLQNRDLRQAINLSINKENLNESGGVFLKPIDQFVPSGILGFNPQISPIKKDLVRAKKLLEGYDFSPQLKIVLSSRLAYFAGLIAKEIKEIGFVLNIEPVSDEQIYKILGNNNFDLYFLGWRFDLGDIGDFLGEVIHSKSEDGKWGNLNFTGFKNEKLDKMIEESFSIMDSGERGEILREIMKIIVADEIIGIPLFESKVLYVHDKNVVFEPRLDTYFLIAEVN